MFCEAVGRKYQRLCGGDVSGRLPSGATVSASGRPNRTARLTISGRAGSVGTGSANVRLVQERRISGTSDERRCARQATRTVCEREATRRICSGGFRDVTRCVDQRTRQVCARESTREVCDRYANREHLRQVCDEGSYARGTTRALAQVYREANEDRKECMTTYA